MNKIIKHNNMLRPNPGINQNGYNYYKFICRGCSMNKRRYRWIEFTNSISSFFNKELDNSYLTFEEEPENKYDSNAIRVVCRGEMFGELGYVGREFTLDVKKILKECISYRIDMLNICEAGQNEIPLIITWKPLNVQVDLQEEQGNSSKINDEEKEMRKKLQLPITKPLRYMKKCGYSKYEEIMVKEYCIKDTYMPSGTKSLEVILVTGEKIRVLAPFFAHMQKDSFVEDVFNEIREIAY